MSVTVLSSSACLQLAGHWQGVSDWVEITQGMVDRFAEVTGDHQFIHTDPERAAATPFGGTIAHGFLTLSLLAALAEPVLPRLAGMRMGVNYGFDRVRFMAPVRTGSRIRAHFRLLEASEPQPGQLRSLFEVNVEIAGQSKPALVAHWLTLQYR